MLDPATTAATSVASTEPTLGITGWFAVFVHAVVAWLCLRAFMTEKSGPPRPYRQSLAALWRIVKKHWPAVPAPAKRAALWVLVAGFMVALGVNRLFDVDTFLVDTWRQDAMAGGGYDGRRGLQTVLVGVIGIAALGSAVGLLFVARGALKDFRLVLSGTLLVLTLAVVRAVSLHAIDAVMRVRVLGVSVEVLVELAALGVVGLAAALRLRRAGVSLWRRRVKVPVGSTNGSTQSKTAAAQPTTSSVSQQRPSEDYVRTEGPLRVTQLNRDE